jgi:signal transduction histidine kinase
MRRSFLRRLGCLFGLLILVLFLANTLLYWLVPGHPGRQDGDGGPGAPFGFFGVVILLIVFVVVGRALRRTAAPIGDVMDAADRVAAGDYAVRVDARGSGEVGRLVASFNEMTARLQANEAQRRSLLADVAHELRTPLVVIRGNVEGMLDGVYPRDDEHLRPILDETTLMARLLDDLRTLSMAEAGALRLYREPTDAAVLIDDIVATFAPRASAAGIALSAASTERLPDLDIDPVRVREVIENLVVNALRHTPAGGSIRIEVDQQGSSAAFAVIDSGSGIAPDQLPFVFDRFTRSADSGGSGLGLAIAKSLVEAHGGAIRAESRLGQGTAIRFTLPIE